MKQRSLLFTFWVLFSFFSGTHVWGQDQTVSPADEFSNGSLTDVVNLKLSGNWSSADISKLGNALHPGGNFNNVNTALQTVTYAPGTEFTGSSFSLAYLFSSCTSLASVDFPAYSGGMVNLTYTFRGCKSLERINSETPGEFDLTGFSGGISNLIYAFSSCSQAVSLKLPGNSSTAVNLSSAFSGCISLVRINSETPGEFDLTGFSGGISALNDAFSSCSQAVSLKLPANSSAAVDFSRAFYNCSSLTRINSGTSGAFDLTGFSGGISNLRYAFYGCSEAVSITLPAISSTAADLTGVFQNCSSLSRINSGTSGEFNLTGFSGVISALKSTFSGCSQAVSITLPANSSAAVDFSYAFQNCSSLSKINSGTSGEFDLTGFSGGISDLSNTFSGCSQAVSIALPGYSSAAVGFSFTFYNCISLTRINSEIPGEFDLTGFSASALNYAFYGCSPAVFIKLPGNTSTATSFIYAFYNCSSLRSIEGLERYTNVSALTAAFQNCYSLSSVELGSIPASGTSSTFNGTNPNCLKFLPEGSTFPAANWSGYSNFIIGSQSRDNITLSDRSGGAVPGEAGFNPFDCPREFTIAPGCSITYTRPAANLEYATSAGGWNTLALPFDATLQVGGVAKAPVTTTQNGEYWLRSFASATAGGEVTFSDTEDGLIRANVPYLLALPGSSFGDDSMQGQDAVFTSAVSSAGAPVQVKASSDVDYSAHEYFSYRGVFTPLVASPAYLLTPGSGGSGDSFVQYNEGNASSFRAYFTEVVGNGQPSGVHQLRISDGGSPTSLSSVFLETGNDSLNPRKVLTREGFRIIKGNLVYSLDGSLVGEWGAEE